MSTISTTRLGHLIGLPVSIQFLKDLGVEPIHQTGYRTAMWDEDDLNHILMEMGLHFINKANTEASLLAPHGYKKNGEPSKKRGRPSRLQALMEKTK
jgi:hypothetical protein